MQMTRLLGKLVTYSLLHATLTLAQPGPSNTDILAPEFEVASIREDESGSTMQRVMMLFESDEFTATHVTLKMLIALGYGIDEDQIIGAPAWTNSDEYEIQARIDSVTSDKLKKLDDDQRKIAQQHMLQALLADRFKLAVHREAKEMPIYSLVIARHGSKLHEVGTREPGDRRDVIIIFKHRPSLCRSIFRISPCAYFPTPHKRRFRSSVWLRFGGRPPFWGNKLRFKDFSKACTNSCAPKGRPVCVHWRIR